MRFARQHPFYGWLSLEPADYRRIYNQLIQMRDADLKKGDNSSGFPKYIKILLIKLLAVIALPTALYKNQIFIHVKIKANIED